MIVDCAIYREGAAPRAPPTSPTRSTRHARRRDAFLWIGLHEPTEEEFDLVSSEFGLHPLAVEDALKAHQRPKLEVYDDSLFMVLKPVLYEPETDTVSRRRADALHRRLLRGDRPARRGQPARRGAAAAGGRAGACCGTGPTAVLYAVARRGRGPLHRRRGRAPGRTWRSWRRRSSRRTARRPTEHGVRIYSFKRRGAGVPPGDRARWRSR